MGLAWDVTNGVNIDLDASVICLDARYQMTEIIYYGNLQSKNKTIRHMGDERSGDAAGDDESIKVDLERIDRRVQYLGFVINTNTHHEIASFDLSQDHRLDCTAMLMILLYRVGNDWWIHAVGEPADGKTAFDNIDEYQAFLSRTHLVRTQSQAAPKAMQKAKIKVPANLGPGNQLAFRTPAGGMEQITLPQNVRANDTIEVPIVDIYSV